MKTLRSEIEEKIKKVNSKNIDKEKLSNSIKKKKFNKDVLK